MDKAQRKKFIRLVYAKTLRYFAIALVLSAIIASFYGDRLHFVFALCALGGIFLAWGWFTYLHATGMRLPGWKTKPGKKKVPYILRKEKQKMHKPAFAMDNDDFDDDWCMPPQQGKRSFPNHGGKRRGCSPESCVRSCCFWYPL